MFVRLGTLEVQAWRSVARFSGKSHNPAITVMGCMKFHENYTNANNPSSELSLCYY
jgi:hypothetical protein